MALAKDMDRILLTTPRFLLSSWIASARAHGNSSEEQDWLEWNARAQVSSWGSVYANGNTITDYAAKQWGGLIGTYHIPLWQLFFLRMHTAAANGTALAPSAQVEVCRCRFPVFTREQAACSWVSGMFAIVRCHRAHSAIFLAFSSASWAH